MKHQAKGETYLDLELLGPLGGDLPPVRLDVLLAAHVRLEGLLTIGTHERALLLCKGLSNPYLRMFTFYSLMVIWHFVHGKFVNMMQTYFRCAGSIYGIIGQFSFKEILFNISPKPGLFGSQTHLAAVEILEIPY